MNQKRLYEEPKEEIQFGSSKEFLIQDLTAQPVFDPSQAPAEYKGIISDIFSIFYQHSQEKAPFNLKFSFPGDKAEITTVYDLSPGFETSGLLTITLNEGMPHTITYSRMADLNTRPTPVTRNYQNHDTLKTGLTTLLQEYK